MRRHQGVLARGYGNQEDVHLAGKQGKGVATKVLSELEAWAGELSYETCILETGKKQPEAIRLYQKNGYQIIPNYGQYADVENSLCFEKSIGS